MGDDSVRVPREVYENIELLRSKPYLLIAHFHPPTGNVDVEIANRVSCKLLLLWFIDLNLRQPADAKPLQAAMQGRSR